jgi:DNA-directed RNA polymerase sigma subunit (sigma70/sigma32)
MEFGETIGDEEAHALSVLISVENNRRPLEDVGKNFVVTREPIRHLQKIAVAKLRRALNKKDDFLDIQRAAT